MGNQEDCRSETLPEGDKFIWSRLWRHLCLEVLLETVEIILVKFQKANSSIVLAYVNRMMD
jgi:hypothetical protein